MRWLIAHWGDDKKHVFDGVTSALSKLGHECVFIPRHDASRRQELLDAIQSGGFSGMLTWQRFYPMQRDLLDVVHTSSLPTVFMDYGFYPHYETVVFDTQGENAVSTWPALWRSGFVPPDAIYEQRAMTLIRERAAAARCLSMPEELSGLQFPFLFVALQRPQDSVVRYDSNVHDFGEFLRRVLPWHRGVCSSYVRLTRLTAISNSECPIGLSTSTSCCDSGTAGETRPSAITC
jgi:hypothetical protein